MFVLQLLLSLTFLLSLSTTARAATEMPVQLEVDRAFELILRTQVGKAICRDILGADAQALELHLGISHDTSLRLAQNCSGSEASEWIYPTSPSDIRKLSLKSNKARRYKLVHSERNFPIESWTDSFSNITTILTNTKTVNFSRMVQILAHETAVYFDSKSHPLHPGAQDIPHLRDLALKEEGKLNPLVAISDPMIAHTLTYLRALQVEFAILHELVSQGAIDAPSDLGDPYLAYLVSDRCAQSCIEELIKNTRPIYAPFSLPLLAFSPHYRALIMQELPTVNTGWDQDTWVKAQNVFNTLPVMFLRNQFTGDVPADLSRFVYKDASENPAFDAVTSFLDKSMWPMEWAAISESRFKSGATLLEFMKRPLLSGYNISLASGPRARVRPGIIE